MCAAYFYHCTFSRYKGVLRGFQFLGLGFVQRAVGLCRFFARQVVVCSPVQIVRSLCRFLIFVHRPARAGTRRRFSRQSSLVTRHRCSRRARRS
jgi:hypothetical protein